ncbi:MAG: leucine-rich repeat protein [Oscillospiraceae bacterium]|nr:leucine-rich repeat protein [Oscillospiraceae bacterium]
MKNFLSTTKGKIIAGAVTLALIAGVVVLIILLNTGYRDIRVADLTGTSRVTSILSVSDAYKGQNLVSGDNVEVLEKSSLTLALDSDKHVVASELTKFSVEAFGAEGKDSRTIIRLETGTISNQIDNKLLPSESYVVDSPNASMSVRGTVFTVNVYYDNNGRCHTSVEVKEGTVELAEKDTGKVKTLNAGQKANVVSRTNREPDRIPTTSSDIKPVGGDSSGNSDTSGDYSPVSDFRYGNDSATGGKRIVAYIGNDEIVRIPAEIDGKAVTKIDEYAFWKCTNIKEIVIPNSVTEIGEQAFRDCTGLTSIVFPDSVTEIGEFVISGCDGITSVKLPSNYTKIGFSLFSNANGLTNLDFLDGVTEIGELAFYECSGLTSITIPDSVTVIGENAFANCTELKSVVIPDSVKVIKRNAFFNCKGITSIGIPDSVEVIEPGAFSFCKATITYRGNTYTPDQNYHGLWTTINQ